MIDNIYYVLTGFILCCIGLVLVKKNEGLWLAPSSWWLTCFFLHAYADPYLRANSIYSRFEFQSESIVVIYNLLANSLFILGYFIYSFIRPNSSFFVQKKLNINNLIPMDRIFKDSHYFLVVCLLLTSFFLLFYGLYSVGIFSGAKGQFSYGQGGIYRYIITITYLYFSFLPALLLSAYLDPSSKTKLKKIMLWILYLLILIYCIATFGRHLIFTISLILLMVYHARIKRVQLRQFTFFASIFVLVTALSLLRKAGVGITSLDISDAALISDGLNATESIVYIVGTILPGQEVFSNVINIVDFEGKWYGLTYIQSFLSLFLPVDLMFADYSSPTFWFKNIYAPNSQGHGFDFSFMAELYMNFGMLGSLFFLPLGYFIHKLSNNVLKSANYVIVVWSCLIIVDLIVSLRTDSVGLFTRALVFILPLVMYKYIIKWTRRIKIR